MTPVLEQPLHQQCPRCNAVRMFATRLSNDPWGWARDHNRKMASAWLGSHPCRKTKESA